jgi:ComF family protein
MSLLLDLFVPTKCLFCERFGTRVCETCEVMLGAEPRLVYRDGVVGFSAMSYNSNAKALLRSYKELGESELAKPMAKAMVNLIGCFEYFPTLLVPIPSNRSSVRDRGFSPAELIARELSLRIPGLRWSNVLGRNRETKDQSKLAPTERALNQLGSMIAKVGSGRVLLVDDIVTTGASILAAKKSLESAGYFVEGFVTFAETEAKGCTLATQAQLPADGGTSWN